MFFIFHSRDINQATTYHVFPGIELIHNDFHTYRHQEVRLIHDRDIMVIHYCLKGRIEWELNNGKYLFLGEGDLSVHGKGAGIRQVTFPLEHYHGIALTVDIKGVTTIKPMLASFGVDLQELFDRLCGDDRIFIERADRTLENIFTELYGIPEQIRKTYIKIKVLELLLFLSVINISRHTQQQSYFKKSDIIKIKQIWLYLSEHIDSHITLNDLAERFSISQTLLKACFKNVYGMPVYTFIRYYRMQKAAYLLSHTRDKIADIALAVGYSNSSKFAAAFKDELRLTPLEYRKKTRKEQFDDQME